MNYIVMCKVSGGVTGTREAPLKRDGIVQYFDTRQEAQDTASKMNYAHEVTREFSSVNRAEFHYWVEEREELWPNRRSCTR